MGYRLITLILLLLWAPSCGDGGSRTGNAIDVPLAKRTIGPKGGTICFQREGHPLDGAEVTFVENALDEEVEIVLYEGDLVLSVDYDPGAVAISPALRIEPGDRDLAAPMFVTLPVAVPDLGMNVSPVSFGVTQKTLEAAPLQQAPFSDRDFSDGDGAIGGFHLGEFVIGAYMVDADLSTVTIVQPVEVMGSHAVTANSSDPIEIHVNVFGRDEDGLVVDLDELLGVNLLESQFGGDAITGLVSVRVVNTTTMTTRDLRSNVVSELGVAGGQFQHLTTADAFPPTLMPGDPITLEALVQEPGALQFGACMLSDTDCTPILGLPTATFVAVP